MTEYGRYLRSATHLASFDARTRGITIQWAKRTPRQREWVRHEILDRLSREHGGMRHSASLRGAVADAVALANLRADLTFKDKERVGKQIIGWFCGAIIYDFPRVDRRIGHHVEALRQHVDVLLEVVVGDRGALVFNDYIGCLAGGVDDEDESEAA